MVWAMLVHSIFRVLQSIFLNSNMSKCRKMWWAWLLSVSFTESKHDDSTLSSPKCRTKISGKVLLPGRVTEMFLPPVHALKQWRLGALVPWWHPVRSCYKQLCHSLPVGASQYHKAESWASFRFELWCPAKLAQSWILVQVYSVLK